MMKYVRLLLLIITFFAFSSRVSADICDNNHVKQLKALAEQVDVSYEYIDYSDEISNDDEVEENEFVVNLYSVSVNLLSDELYLVHGFDEYYYKDSEDGLINLYVNSGNLKLDIMSTTCYKLRLRTVYLTLPKFNTYSYTEACQNLKEYDLDVCDPWYQGTINDNIFYNQVNKYLVDDDKDNNKFSFQVIIDFLGDNYLIVGGVLLAILLFIIGIIVHRKRSVLE